MKYDDTLDEAVRQAEEVEQRVAGHHQRILDLGHRPCPETRKAQQDAINDTIKMLAARREVVRQRERRRLVRLSRILVPVCATMGAAAALTLASALVTGWNWFGHSLLALQAALLAGTAYAEYHPDVYGVPLRLAGLGALALGVLATALGAAGAAGWWALLLGAVFTAGGALAHRAGYAAGPPEPQE